MDTENKIKTFLEKPERYKRALIIDDDWGTGKSEMIKKVLSGISGFNLDNNVIEYYNVIDAGDIIINSELLNILYYNSKKINTNDYENFLNNSEDKKQNATKKFNFLSKKGKDFSDDSKISNFKSYHWSINLLLDAANSINNFAINKHNYSKYVLVIDEFERCRDIKTMEWLLLKLSKLQEDKKIRIIIIMNSKKLNLEIKNTFEEWSDKISSIKISIDNSKIIKEKLNLLNLENNSSSKKNRNLRIIENYELINDVIEEYLKSKNYYNNSLVENEIIILKQKIYDILIAQNNYLENEEEDDLLLKNEGGICLKEIWNLNYKSIYDSIDNIITKYTLENFNLIEKINLFYKNRVLKHRYYKTINKKHTKKEVIDELKQIFYSKNIFQVVQLKNSSYSIRLEDEFEKYSFLSYLDFIYNNFNLNSKEKYWFQKMTLRFITEDKNDFLKKKNNDEKILIWSKYYQKPYSNKKSLYESIFLNKGYLSLNYKKQIVKHLNKNISYFFNKLLNTPVDFSDFYHITNLAKFKIKYDIDIISSIFNVCAKDQNPLDLKAFMNSFFQNQSLTNSELNKMSFLDKIYRFHNLNEKKRYKIENINRNIVYTMIPFTKDYKIEKLTKKFFIDFNL